MDGSNITISWNSRIESLEGTSILLSHSDKARVALLCNHCGCGWTL